VGFLEALGWLAMQHPGPAFRHEEITSEGNEVLSHLSRLVSGCWRSPMIQNIEYFGVFRTVIPLGRAVPELHLYSRGGVFEKIHFSYFVHIDLIHT
jgi:hypothetical protein